MTATEICYVRQRYARDCGVAALAMLTGHAYERVVAYFHNPDLDANGLYLRGMDDYLVDAGFAVARKYRYLRFFQEHSTAPLREPWPPAPFGEKHLCEVQIDEHSRCYHFAVMLADSRVLDPLFEHKATLAAYFSVLNVAAVVPVSPP